MDKTTQGLKTLAEYMGFEIAARYNSTTGDLTKVLISENNEIEHLAYNTSWDALVPVYSKLYTTELLFVNSAQLNLVEKYECAAKLNDPQAAFEAVVELVKLINKENGK